MSRYCAITQAMFDLPLRIFSFSRNNLTWIVSPLLHERDDSGHPSCGLRVCAPPSQFRCRSGQDGPGPQDLLWSPESPRRDPALRRAARQPNNSNPTGFSCINCCAARPFSGPAAATRVLLEGSCIPAAMVATSQLLLLAASAVP